MVPILTEEELNSLPPQDRKDALAFQEMIDAQEREQAAAETPEAPQTDGGNTAQTATAVDAAPAPDGGTPTSEPAAAEPAAAQPETKVTVEREEFDRLKAELEHTKHKHDVVKGKYDAEVKPKNLEIAQQRARIKELERQLAGSATTTVAPEPVATPTVTVTPTSYDLSEDERNVLGDVGLSAVQKISARESAELKRLLEQERKANQEERERMREEATRVQFSAFEGKLTGLAPNCNENYDNPEFQTWLDGNVDPISKASFRDLHNYYLNQMNAATVAWFHQQFESERKPVEAPKPVPAAPVESQVTPRSSGAPAIIKPPEPAKPKYKYADWSEMMDEVPMKRLKGKRLSDERAAELLAELEAAQQEGRVIP